MSKEAMKLALEALEYDGLLKRKQAITAIRESLAEQQAQQEPVAGKGKELSERLKLCARNVAFVAAGRVDMSSAAMQEMFALIDHVCVGLDSPQPAQQEPVAWIDEYGNAFPLAAKQYSIVGKHWKPLYTSTPAQRTWVGLTPEEVQAAVYDENGCVVDYEDYASAIEAKLKEKNT